MFECSYYDRWKRSLISCSYGILPTKAIQLVHTPVVYPIIAILRPLFSTITYGLNLPLMNVSAVASMLHDKTGYLTASRYAPSVGDPLSNS